MLGDWSLASRARLATGVTLVTLLFTSTVVAGQEIEPDATATTTQPEGPVDEPAPTTTTFEEPAGTTNLPATSAPATIESGAPETTVTSGATESQPVAAEVPGASNQVAAEGPDAVADCSLGSTVDSTSSEAEVRCLEDRLAELGFFAEVPDGVWDADTAAAVEAFQAGEQLVQTGTADPFTLWRMGIWEGAEPAFQCTVIGQASANSSGGRVACLEARLADLGFFRFVPDGEWTVATKRAVKSFQESARLVQSGVADPFTLWRMGIWSSAVRPDFQCSVSGAVSSASSRGRVACLEARLADLGFFRFVPDGEWTVATKRAVKSFQANRSLIRSGTADPFTLQKMRIWGGARVGFPCRIGSAVGPSSSGQPVACLEMRLALWGYDIDGPDRTFDAKTRAAIKAYEKSQNFIANAKADPYTLQQMGIWSGGRVRFPCAVDTTVRPGDSGRKVACLEMRLATWGYSINGPDRSFDRKTGRAIKAFERNRGLVANRTAGRYTLYRMGIWSGNVPSFPCSVSARVGPKASAKRINCLESRLRDLGYSLNGPDGTYDSTTTRAIRAYQSSHSLSADGVAGPYTLASMGIWGGSPPDTILPANSGTGRRIVYSKSRMRLWTVESNGTVSKTHRVSGNHAYNNPSPGTYSVYSKSSRTCAVDASHICWGYMVRFAYGPQGGRIGFHEIPTNLQTGAKLQSESQLGLGLSAGCVRQATRDAIYIWHWAPVGTKVVVLG